MLEFVLNFLFPPVCVLCGKQNEDWLCENCKNRIQRFEKCECIQAKKDQTIHCKPIYFDELLYIFSYKKVVRKLILKYKFARKSYLYHFFTSIILNSKKCCEKIKLYDIMMPVPMYEKKKKQRGYNQTELVAKAICDALQIPLQNQNLVKIKDTKTQSTLSIQNRKENIKNAFLVYNKDSIQGKRIILLDDIYTTGATVNEIARILKCAGAREILVFVLAKD